MHSKSPNNFNDPILLSKIDKLFACGVGDYIDLPQLVVVGDQSSGKSSVLEGLTSLPFPRDSGLCTRFATQITFRRAQETSNSVSIIPAAGASPEHIASIKAWRKIGLGTLDKEAFSDIMMEVHQLMGLGDQNAVGGKGTFSEDVLRLEIGGPEQEHFSVVDVPGIFRKTTEGVTTKTDKEMVTSMVRSYMRNPRSVILAVIPANVDIATQEILTMAEEVDEDGHRTLGVLTKPDLVDAGAEPPIMELVQGKRHRLTLGWCIVRNPGQQQLNDPENDRNSAEKLFFRNRAPWNTLDEDRVGVGALRIRLQQILAGHIRREFPKVKTEINKKLTTARQLIKHLGSERETTTEQSQYLLQISMDFQKFTADALRANYSDDWFDERPSLRIVTEVVNRNEKFAKTLERHGLSYQFKNVEERMHPEESDAGSEFADDHPADVEEKEIPGDELSIRTTENHPDLEEVMFDKDTISKKIGKDTLGWLKTVYTTSRGTELGTFDPSILATTMKTQSSKWEALALCYISDIVSMVHTFIIDLLKLICPDARVRDELMSVLMEDLMAKYKTAFDHVLFLLRVERLGTPATLNHYFNDNLEKSRQTRMRAAVADKAIDDSDNGIVVPLDDLTHNHPMSNVEYLVRDIHDILKSYYKVARKRFVDNVCIQASDYHLVTGPETPLKLFSPTFVSHLSPEQLEQIAGEDVAVKSRREALKKEIKDLEAGKKILT